MKTYRSIALFGLLLAVGVSGGVNHLGAQPFVYLTGAPDYSWHRGCFGTASGNLAGFWDRHGYSNIYTGSVDQGVAPLSDNGKLGIRSMWASQAHDNDYWIDYESTAADPYVTAGRAEHRPDCIGDFIGLSQSKWASLAGECRGNIDAYSFVFWDKTGNRRVNYYTTNATTYVPDIGSGLKEWMRWRGYDADVFTQLTDFNPERTTAAGFSYEDVKREINAGYPVLCFLQPSGVYSRSLGGFPNVNPAIHGVMIYGYFTDTFSGYDKGVIIHTSWGTGETLLNWSGQSWLGLFPVRGVIGFHPKPKITGMTRSGGNLTLTWNGPATYLYDQETGTSGPVQRYAVQRAVSISAPDWKNITSPSTNLSATFPEPADTTFYRIAIQQ